MDYLVVEKMNESHTLLFLDTFSHRNSSLSHDGISFPSSVPCHAMDYHSINPKPKVFHENIKPIKLTIIALPRKHSDLRIGQEIVFRRKSIVLTNDIVMQLGTFCTMCSSLPIFLKLKSLVIQSEVNDVTIKTHAKCSSSSAARLTRSMTHQI